MSLRILHLTLVLRGLPVALDASKITLVINKNDHTDVSVPSKTVSVQEPYDQVLRMWADALSSD